MTRFDPRVTPWQIDAADFPGDAGLKEKLAFLLRYAILAPSTHNTQPWKFAIEDNEVRVYADKMRWLQVADAAQRELHVSVGCAVENLLIAAAYFGFDYRIRRPEPSYEDVLGPVAAVEFDPADASRAETVRSLFGAIRSRRTNRNPFEPTPIPEDRLAVLRSAVADEGLSLYLGTDQQIKDAFHRLVVEADEIQFANPEFRRELSHWIGQSGYQLPWPMSGLARLALRYGNAGASTAAADVELLKRTPVLGIVGSREDDLTAYVRVGQALERLYLRATDLGMGLQPLGQICEVPSIRSQLGELISKEGFHLQLPFRLGYAKPQRGHTPRRPLEEVLI